MNKIFIYNTLKRKKEIFVPISKGNVGMYVCGPTVYGDPHLGHARPAITFDVVFRYLKKNNYKVRYVRNITDAGHLENDAEEGQDKIVKKAKLEQLEPMEIVQQYTLSYHDAMRQLNCLPPSIEPRATGHILEQIEMVKKIIKRGFAYEINGSVYLDVVKYNKEFPYGELSGRNIEDTLEGTRKLDSQSEKKSPTDFAIWKKASNEHIMRWNSPWGEGFPGWHLECSAMSEKYLGKQFDIHGGGMDLIFPHHEAEIAQSKSCHGCSPVKYWMHNNMITINGQKMGKSLGNFINLNQFFEGSHKNLTQAYSPMTIRFFILQAHYRSTLDFSNTALKAAEKGLQKLIEAFEKLDSLKPSKESSISISKIKDECYQAMNDDFNTPILISHLFECVKIVNSNISGDLDLISSDIDLLKFIFEEFMVSILGISPISKTNSTQSLTKDILNLVIKVREQAKIEKNYLVADMIRDELESLNIKIKDTRDGVVWKIKND